MSEVMPDVHEWTLNWYSTLPEAYRSLDKHQFASHPSIWKAFTADPNFYYGWGLWDVTAPLQTQTEIMVAMTRTFQGYAGEPVYIQAWWAAPTTPGTLLQVIKTEDAAGPQQEITVEPSVGEPGNTEMMFYPAGDGKFTVRILILVPVPEGNLLELIAANVGPKRVGIEELPVNGQAPATFRPLLRFMDGIGRIGGEFRRISDALWDGVYTNPATVPERHLKWLAQMIGVPQRMRDQSPPDRLREYMGNAGNGGTNAVGSANAIAEAARAFLTGERMASVIPHEETPHTLILMVKPDEVPGGDLQALTDKVRESGAVPAGHALIAKEAVSTWDAWEAAAGTTWTELENAAPTWVRADSLGINLGG